MKRRRRRSSAVLADRAMADIRRKHREHLREISAILSNTLGFPVRVSLVKTPEVSERPRKRVSGKARVSRAVAVSAGFGDFEPEACDAG